MITLTICKVYILHKAIVLGKLECSICGEILKDGFTKSNIFTMHVIFLNTKSMKRIKVKK